MLWQVVPICEAQLQDVNPSDILNGGLYRKCNTYKGGGGYDQFPAIYNRRNGINRIDLNNQFVVQLKGCPLRCHYCYVTPEGVNSVPVKVSTFDMVAAYHNSGCSVFHLMGGAPALYIERWHEIIEMIAGYESEIFHSDLLCIEKQYDRGVLQELASHRHSLYAISVKGSTPEEFRKNTGTTFNERLFEKNLEALFDIGVPCYFTFTGMSLESVQYFKDTHSDYSFDDSFTIDLIRYNALDHK